MSLSISSTQLVELTKAFHQGAREASAAISRWLNAPLTISVDAVDQCPLEQAIAVLGTNDEPICMSLMEMEGTLTGHMLLAFDDKSGLFVSDLLLGNTPGTATSWGEVEVSCVQETMNIAGSAYLNGIARNLTERQGGPMELVPSPPVFLRDFGESLLASAFMDQAISSNEVVFARTRFDLAGEPMRWTFLLIPDPASLGKLSEILNGLA